MVQYLQRRISKHVRELQVNSSSIIALGQSTRFFFVFSSQACEGSDKICGSRFGRQRKVHTEIFHTVCQRRGVDARSHRGNRKAVFQQSGQDTVCSKKAGETRFVYLVLSAERHCCVEGVQSVQHFRFDAGEQKEVLRSASDVFGESRLFGTI